MAILVRTCCCGCDLKTGILLIALFGMLTGGYGIFSSFKGAKTLSHLHEEAIKLDSERLSPVPYKYYQDVINLLYTSGVFNILVLFTSALLMLAYCLANRFMAIPYIVLQLILLAYNLGVVIFYIVVWKGSGIYSVVIGAIISWLLSIYFIIVAFSFHEALREDPSGASAGYARAAPTVQAAGRKPPYAV